MAEGQTVCDLGGVRRKTRGVRQNSIEAALDDSTCSVRDEPGCLQFDVLAPTAGGNKFAFYEVYKSRDAFTAHMETAAFQEIRGGGGRGAQR